MSDTPRTDAVVAEINRKGYDHSRRDYELGSLLYDQARRLEIEAHAWKEAFRNHCTSFYAMKAVAGEIPSDQVRILTDMAVNEYAAQIAAYELPADILSEPTGVIHQSFQGAPIYRISAADGSAPQVGFRYFPPDTVKGEGTAPCTCGKYPHSVDCGNG